MAAFLPRSDWDSEPSLLKAELFRVIPPPLGHLIQGIRIAKPFPPLHSSFGPETEEVQTMKESHRRGDTLAVYEFMQGMHDYQDKDPAAPPARTRIIYDDGTSAVFAGNDDFLTGVSFNAGPDRHIARIDFINSGVGLRPQNLLDVRHPRTEHRTLGMHGRGTTVAATFLTSAGMPVDVYSNTKSSRAWVGRTALRHLMPDDPESSAEDQPVLHLDGGYCDAMPFKGTIISVYNPDETFCRTLRSAGNLFLYANPRFPYANLVPKDEAFIAQAKGIVEMPVEQGTVMCLGVGMVDAKVGKCGIVYVDGKRMQLHGNYNAATIFPWSINGLSTVKRSHDSDTYTGDAGEVIATAVRQLTDRDLLEGLILCAVEDKRKNNFQEFDNFTYYGSKPPLHTETKTIVCNIWEQHYGKTVITDSEEKAKRYEANHKTPPVVCLERGFYHFLKEAGVRNLDMETGEVDVRNITSQGIKVGLIHEEKPLEKFMERVARQDGKVDIISIDGKPYLRVQFPGTGLTADDFAGQTDNPAGLMLRMGAVLAHHLEIEAKACSVSEKEIEEFTIEVSSTGSNFVTKIGAVTYQRKDKKEYAPLQPGNTYLLLSGDAINSLGNRTSLEKLKKVFAEYARRMTMRAAEMPVVRKIVQRRRQEARRAAGWHPDFAPPADLESYTMGLGQQTAHDAEHPLDAILGHPEAVIQPGHYAGHIGRYMKFDHKRQRVSLADHPQFARIEVPENKPRRYSARIPLDYFRGPQKIVVPEEHQIIGYELYGGPHDDVEFYQDQGTGVYLVQGRARRVVYYTAPYSKGTTPPWVSAPPKPSDTENVIDQTQLDPQWRTFIQTLKSHPSNLEKVNRVHAELIRRFTYSTDPALDTQMEGKTLGSVTAQILNQSSGICNVIAVAAMLILRAVGVPAYVCGGYFVSDDGRGGSHAYVRFWDGYRWIKYEPQAGMRNQSTMDYAQPVHLIGEELPPPSIVHQKDTTRKAALAILIAAGLGSCATLYNTFGDAAAASQANQEQVSTDTGRFCYVPKE